MRFDRVRVAGHASQEELVGHDSRDFGQGAGVHTQFAFGFEHELHEFAREVIPLLLELLPHPFGAFGEERTLEAAGEERFVGVWRRHEIARYRNFRVWASGLAFRGGLDDGGVGGQRKPRWASSARRADLGPDALEAINVLGVRAFVLDPGHFEQERDLGEGRVGHQRAEAFEADHAVADVLVPVTHAAEAELGVVGVDGDEPFEADEPAELLHRDFTAFARREVVAHREGVAGIEADGDARVVVEPADERAQLGEVAAHDVSLAGAVLQNDERAVGRRFHGGPNQPARLLHDRVKSGAKVAADVENRAHNAQFAGPAQVRRQRSFRLDEDRRILAAEVHQIDAVKEDGDAGGGVRLAESRHLRFGQGRGAPLLGGRDEELDGLAADQGHPLEDSGRPAGAGNVCSNSHFVSIAAAPVDTRPPTFPRWPLSLPLEPPMFPDVPHTGLPLSGLRVIDCTHWQQGPYATAMLGQFGADVIKVEGPDAPDPGRGMAGATTTLNAYFESHNHNKRSLVIDLKHPEGREAVLRLVETADVFVQNMRPGVMERLGLAYEDLRARNPRIIYATASGYGAEGPHARWPAMDMLAQARGGTMMAMGPPDDAPFFAFGGMADQVGALYLCNGILMALWHRARTGEGQAVDGSLLGGQVALQAFNITGTLFNGAVPPQVRREQRAPLWNIYECADGRYIALAMAQYGRWWPRLMAALDCPALRDNRELDTLATAVPHFPAVVAELDRVFASRPQREWQEYLAGECGLAVASVQDYGQLVTDPMAEANQFFVDYPNPEHPGLKMVGPGVTLSRSPGSIRTRAPEYGEHSEEVLLEAGYSWEEIVALREARVIG